MIISWKECVMTKNVNSVIIHTPFMSFHNYIHNSFFYLCKTQEDILKNARYQTVMVIVWTKKKKTLSYFSKYIFNVNYFNNLRFSQF